MTEPRKLQDDQAAGAFRKTQRRRASWTILGAAATLLWAAPTPAARTSSTSIGLSEAYYQFMLGKESQLSGNLAESAEHFTLALAADDSTAIRVELAQTYMRMGNLDKAIEQARLATEKNPDDPDPHKALAEAFLASGARGSDRFQATAMAIGEYRALVRIEPGNHDARLMLGRLLLQEDRVEEALEQFRALKSSGADPVQSGLMAARALLRADRRNEGESELKSVLAIDPRNYEALLGLAQLAENREEWSAASSYYARLIEVRASDGTLRYRLGYTLLRAGRKEEAVDAIREATAANPSDRSARELLAQALRAAGRPGEALHELSVLLEYQPGDAALLVEIARIHELRSENDAALEAYRAALSASDAADKPLLAPDAAAGLVLAIATLELVGGDGSAALRTLGRIPDDGSEISYDAGILKARALTAGGQTAAAVALAQALMGREPANPRGALVLLEARLAGRPQTSTAAAALAEFHPESRPPRQIGAAAEILRKAGHPRLGLSILTAILTSHPQDPRAEFAVGAYYQSIGDLAESDRHIRRAVDLDPKDPLALNYLGYALADRGKELPYAESLIRKALEVEPDSGAYLDSLGWVLMRQGRLDEAETAMLRAADLQAGDGTVREHMGDVYLKKGDSDRALAEWKLALGLDPEDPKRLRRKIQGLLRDKGRQ